MNISKKVHNIKYHYIVVGNGNWSKNYKQTLSNFNNIITHDLSCNLEFHSVIEFISKIYEEYSNCTVILACHPKLQSKIISRLGPLDVSMIIEKPLAYDAQSYKNLQDFVNIHPNRTLAGFFTLLNPNNINFRRMINKHKENLQKIVIYDGSKGPYRKQLGAFYDWAPHTFATLQSINLSFENVKLAKLKSDHGDIFKLNGRLHDIVVEAYFGNGFDTKNRSASILLKNNSLKSYDFTHLSEKRKYREMHRLINFSIRYFYNKKYKNFCLYHESIPNDKFILDNARISVRLNKF